MTLLAAAALGGCAIETMEDEDVGVVASPLSAKSSKFFAPAAGSNQVRIDVCFENGSSAERTFVQNVVTGSWEGIATRWEALNPSGRASGVDFRGWPSCGGNTTNWLRVRFFNSTDPVEVPGDSTNTSFTRGIGKDTIKQTSNGAVNFLRHSTQIVGPFGATTVIHEFGHVLGFTHEYLRDDATESCKATEGTVPDLGITGFDKLSIMDANECTRSSTLTRTDEAGFALVYGPWAFTNWEPVSNALRLVSSGKFVSVASGSTVPNASSSAITSRTDLQVVSLESHGGVVVNGRVRIVGPNGQFFVQNADNTVSTTASATAATIWIVRAGFSGGVRANDEILLQSSTTNRMLDVNSSARLVTSVGYPTWRLIGHVAAHM